MSGNIDHLHSQTLKCFHSSYIDGMMPFHQQIYRLEMITALMAGCVCYVLHMEMICIEGGL